MRYGVILAALCACGRIGFSPLDEAAMDAATDGTGSSLQCGMWSVPVPLTDLNAVTDGDAEPALSPDGSTIVFTSSRIGGVDRLFRSTRQGQGWTTPTVIASLDSGAMDSGPAWNATGDRLYFASYRAGPLALYVSSVTGGVFGPPALVPGLESLSESTAPTIRGDELEMFFSSRLPPRHIEWATRSSTSAPWQSRGNVPELVTTFDHGYPGVTTDGLELYFEADRATGGFEIARAVRPTVDAPFGAPQFVPELAAGGSTGDPQTSVGGTEMVLASDRASFGDFDLYHSTRVCN